MGYFQQISFYSSCAHSELLLWHSTCTDAEHALLMTINSEPNNPQYIPGIDVIRCIDAHEDDLHTFIIESHFQDGLCPNCLDPNAKMDLNVLHPRSDEEKDEVRRYWRWMVDSCQPQSRLHMNGLGEAIKLRERLITLLNRNPGSVNARLTDEQITHEIAQLEDEIGELRERRVLLSDTLDMIRYQKAQNISLFDRTHVLEDGWDSDLLAVVDYSKIAEDAECAICVEKMAVGRVRILPCGHLFHRHCIWTWLQSRDSCPYCRKEYRIYRGPGGRGLGWVGLFGADDEVNEEFDG